MVSNYISIITTEFLNRLKEQYGSLTFCYSINEYTDSLVNALLNRYKSDFLIANSSLIENSIKHFFEPIYKLNIKFDVIEEKLSIKINVIQGGDNAITEQIYSLIHKLFEYKSEVFKLTSENNIITIQGELKDKIFSFITSEADKEPLKIAIKEAFELDGRDLIIFFVDKIVIKKFSLKGYERRFNGIPPEDLIELKAKIFPDSTEIKKIAVLVVKSAMRDELSFDRITPTHFLINSVKIFQKYLFVELGKKLTGNDNILLEGLGNYIFRENFDFMYSIFNRYLLEAVMNKDLNAQKFVQYFSGDTDLEEDGSRYERPSIYDEHKQKISPLTIISIAIQHKNNLNVINKQDEILKKSEEELNKVNKNLDRLLDEEKILNSDFKKVIESKEFLDREMLNLNEKLMHQTPENTKRDEIANDLKKVKDNLHKLSEKESSLSEKLKINKSNISSLTATQQKLTKKIFDENKKKENFQISHKQTTLKFKNFEKIMEKTIKLKRKKIS